MFRCAVRTCLLDDRAVRHDNRGTIEKLWLCKGLALTTTMKSVTLQLSAFVSDYAIARRIDILSMRLQRNG